MNKLLLLAVVILAGYVAWTKKDTLSEWKDTALAQVSAYRSGNKANPEPVKEVPVAPAPPTLPAFPTSKDGHLSTVKVEPPENIFYLRAKVSFKGPAGVRVIPAGAEVRKLEDDGKGMVTVDDGKGPFPVVFSNLTKDNRVAAVLRQNSSGK